MLFIVNVLILHVNKKRILKKRKLDFKPDADKEEICYLTEENIYFFFSVKFHI